MTVKDSGCNGVERLKEGNRRYLQVKNEIGDISPAVRRDTCVNGQNPFALIYLFLRHRRSVRDSNRRQCDR